MVDLEKTAEKEQVLAEAMSSVKDKATTEDGRKTSTEEEKEAGTT